MRLGLVGVGAWGRRYADTISKRTDCRLVAVARASSRPGERIFGLPVSSDWHELIELQKRAELDGLIVASTPENQAEVVAAAIESGAPILAEKPLGFTQAVSERLLSLWTVSERRAPVLVNFVHLWAPAFVALQRLVRASGGSSAIRRITAQGCAAGPVRGWSTLYDYGPHDCAMLVRLLGSHGWHIVAAHRHDAVAAQTELFDFELRVGTIAVALQLGNGSRAKKRRFAVELTGGRVLVYDDTAPHPNKLTVDGTPIGIATTLPLDAVIGDYLARIECWRSGSSIEALGENELGFCCEVAGVLDALAASTLRCSCCSP